MSEKRCRQKYGNRPIQSIYKPDIALQDLSLLIMYLKITDVNKKTHKHIMYQPVMRSRQILEGVQSEKGEVGEGRMALNAQWRGLCVRRAIYDKAKMLT